MNKIIHQESVQVRWGDMDALNHVNNAQYFSYMEQARVAWLYQVVGDISSQTTGPVLASTSCQFIKPLHYPDHIDIKMIAGPLGCSSLPLYYEFFSEEQSEIVAKGESLLVWFDFLQKKSCAIPENIRQCIIG
ncbi:MAG: thioesterase [Gammaproteobacteria bacterium CG22_combo_CG10-13_8_21_14_all_40_8]|nr:MAG: thioesterase [Gammaproteobacteria bacterium CG22_combo_CG10-13_8_21_14_all_40_8]